MSITSENKTPAAWSDDCQGKKDYDGNIVLLSTRYWPASYQGNGNCSAKASIKIQYGEPDKNGYTYDSAHLTSKEFEAPTETEVKDSVESWAQNEMDFIVKSLRDAYRNREE